MNGVEILSQEVIYNTVLPPWCIAVGFMAGFISVILMVVSIVYENGLGVVLSALALVASIIVAGLGDTYSKTDINHVEYKVIINDSVSMTEFMDKYMILDQEGRIYTVREKE